MFGEVWRPDAIEREGKKVLELLSDANKPLSTSEPMAKKFIKRCERLLKDAGLASQDSAMCPIHANIGYRESNRCNNIANYWIAVVSKALEDAKTRSHT